MKKVKVVIREILEKEIELEDYDNNDSYNITKNEIRYLYSSEGIVLTPDDHIKTEVEIIKDNNVVDTFPLYIK